MNKALLILLSMTVLASCAQLPPASTPQRQLPPETAEVAWYPTQLYRGLRVLPGTVNQIDWSRVSFGVSGNPATLSLFNNMAVAAAFPCWLRITVDVPGNPPPAPLVIGDLTIPNRLPAGPIQGRGPCSSTMCRQVIGPSPGRRLAEPATTRQATALQPSFPPWRMPRCPPRSSWMGVQWVAIDGAQPGSTGGPTATERC